MDDEEPHLPPAFLEDDGEGSEWGWSDWDGVDWQELLDIAGGPWCESPQRDSSPGYER